MAKSGPGTFIKEVRNEAKKVSWPTRRETIISMIAVFVMVFISSIFLYFADQIISWLVRTIMNIGL